MGRERVENRLCLAGGSRWGGGKSVLRTKRLREMALGLCECRPPLSTPSRRLRLLLRREVCVIDHQIKYAFVCIYVKLCIHP